MPPAARVLDLTMHPGFIAPPGVPTVLISGMPAAVQLGIHTCLFPPPAGPHPPTPFPKGSLTVRIGGRGALRVGDVAGCGAAIISGAPKVMIGG